MTPQEQLNVILESFCIVICITLLLHQILIKNRRDVDKWFAYSLCHNIAMMLGDMTDWTLDGSDLPWAAPVFTVGMVLYFASSGGLMYSFLAYVYHYWKDKLPISRRLNDIGCTIMLVQVFLAVISPFTGAIFSITKDSVYSRGPFFFLAQLTAIVSYIIMLMIYVKAWRHGVMKMKEKICFFIYLFLPLTGELIQIMGNDLVILNVFVTLAFLLVNLFINTELDEKLQDTERARINALIELQTIHENLVDETITSLSNAVEAKDRYTNGHSQRVAFYARELVKRMGWNEEDQQKVYYTGLLHDVGKIRIHDAIINKPGRLTDEEYNEIKLHSLVGYHILKKISSISDFAVGARWHHERYDGKGYPDGLAGENIPIIARVISVADAYDAMTSNRSYRCTMSRERVRQEIEKGLGTQFDPEIGKIMLEIMDEDQTYNLRQVEGRPQKTILTITDDDELLTLFDKILQTHDNYRLVHEHSADYGIVSLDWDRADLVVIDIATEGEDGLKILSWIHNRKTDIPVIIVSGDKDFYLLKKAEAMGISEYLTKPLAIEPLSESLENAFLEAEKSIS